MAFSSSKIFLILIIVSSLHAQQKEIFNNPSFPAEERAGEIVSRMTLEEKVSQMLYNAPAIERLGIPEYNWWGEALHGVARNGLATVFPQSIGLAATWNTDLMYKVTEVISDEARAKYHDAVKRGERGLYQGLTFWSPNINIFRDPRWGRGMETYGEDPFLTSEMGKAFVKGMQGNDPHYFKTIATPKHYAVHSGPEPLRHSFDAQVSDYDLWETYLPAFKASVVDAKAFSIMCAYNRFRGKACCGSDSLLNEILRNSWGFKGYVVSDCGAIHDLFREGGHYLADTPEEAAALGANSGTDLNCGSIYPSLVDAVEKGLISQAVIDTSVKRLFTARLKLGMFDPDEMVPYSGIPLSAVNSESNRRIALQAARESIVLLKNENNTLPLKKSIKKIAVIGPNADDIEVLHGNYNGTAKDPVTPLQGIINKVSGDTEVIYEMGCETADNLPSFNIIGSEYLYTSNEANKQNGLLAEYFNNRNFHGVPSYTRIDKEINFIWWDSAPYEDFDINDFSVRWTGYLVAPSDGEYDIGAWGFNSFRVFFEDSLMLDYDANHHARKKYFTADLREGQAYKIKIEFYEKSRYSEMQLIWSVPDHNREEKAITAAKNADVVIMFMGLSPRLEGEEMDVPVEGFHGGDRIKIDLPGIQTELLRKINSLGKPIVLILLNGSALAIKWEKENIPAIIEAWYPGQAAGTAIADILFGDYNPSGKLPVTFYRATDQLPPFENYDMNGRTYRYFNDEVIYCFGHGLSYTSFEIDDINIDKQNIKTSESAKVSFRITNTGKSKGDEVVQLYIKNPADNKALKTLKGFKKISLNPRESKTGEFEISPEILKVFTGDDYSVEPGNYILMIGNSSDNMNLQKINLQVIL